MIFVGRWIYVRSAKKYPYVIYFYSVMFNRSVSITALRTRTRTRTRSDHKQGGYQRRCPQMVSLSNKVGGLRWKLVSEKSFPSSNNGDNAPPTHHHPPPTPPIVPLSTPTPVLPPEADPLRPLPRSNAGKWPPPRRVLPPIRDPVLHAAARPF